MTHTAISLEQRKKQLDQIEQVLLEHVVDNTNFFLVMCILILWALLLALLAFYFFASAIYFAAAIVFGWGWLAYREMPLKKWSLDTRLNNYSPLDAGAFKKLQQECRTFGDLDPIAVYKWLEIEKKSVESQGNDLAQEISNKTLPTKKPKILQFLNRDLSVH